MSLGARLREKRERQQITLRAIADDTKIKLALLEGLERDDVSQWPGGIFRRAYVRAYAQAIGLQPDVVVREFLERYPDPEEDIVTAVAAVTGADERGPIARLRAAVGLGSRTPAADLHAPRAIARPIEARLVPAPPNDAPSPVEPASETDPEPAVPPSPAPAIAVEAPLSAGQADVPPPARSEPDLARLAELCTALSCVEHADELTALVERIAKAVDAAGLIVWLWDGMALRPTLAHGYSPTVLAHLPAVDRDARNATAAAFRLVETCIVSGSAHANGALAVPLRTGAGCGGVLAIELPHGAGESAATRAAAEIIAAQLAAMMRVSTQAEADRRLA